MCEYHAHNIKPQQPWARHSRPCPAPSFAVAEHDRQYPNMKIYIEVKMFNYLSTYITNICMYPPSLAEHQRQYPNAYLFIYRFIYTHTHTHTHIHMYAYVCMLPRSQSNRGRTAKRLAEGFLVETARAALLPPFTDSPKISSASVSSPKSAPALLLLLLPRYRDRRQHTHNNDDADDDNNNTNTTNNNVSAKEAFEEARRSSVPLPRVRGPRKFGAPDNFLARWSLLSRPTVWGRCGHRVSRGCRRRGSGPPRPHYPITGQSQGNHTPTTVGRSTPHLAAPPLGGARAGPSRKESAASSSPKSPGTAEVAF